MQDNVKYIKDKLKNNMIMFGKVIMPNMFSVSSPDFHYQIADAIVDNNNKQINIIAPRGHAKSSIVGGVYPLFHIMNHSGAKLIVLVSHTSAFHLAHDSRGHINVLLSEGTPSCE